ncbi:TetR/AcrR family transcriptional regulator [Streptomyces sp. NPDC058221]|uniref:TetR/AcrR family transcriptional regulator n=1 Tax=Streptomyces sp. NPDC058221 TaxID=3346388 RepID=UPI0036EDCD20
MGRTVTPRPAKPLRADARRNYLRLLEAAGEAFAENGADAPFDDIAKRAGVGSATLYRHFPTRVVLLDAVFRDRVDALCELAEALLDSPSAGGALEQWLRAVIEHSRTYRGLAAEQLAIEIDEGPSLSAARHARITEAGRRLFVRAQESGEIATEHDITSALKFVNAIAWATEQAPAPAEQIERLLSIAMTGLLSRA